MTETETRGIAVDVIGDVMNWYRKPYSPGRFSSGQSFALITHVGAGKPLFELAKVVAQYGRSHPNDAFSEIQIITVADYLEAGGQPFNRERWLKLAGVSEADG